MNTSNSFIDMKTGRLGTEFKATSVLAVALFVLGAYFVDRTGSFHGYIHEYGHIFAAAITGGSGELRSAHSAYIETTSIFAPFVASMGVGSVFLVYYFLSSPKLWKAFPYPRAFFLGGMVNALTVGQTHAEGDFSSYPMGFIIFTAMWIFLIYKRIKGRINVNK